MLPLLFSFLGGGLAKAGVLGSAGSFLSNPLVASAMGSGIGTFAETGDAQKALMGGLGSFAGGHLLGNVMGGGAQELGGALEAPLPGQSVVGPGTGTMTTGTPLYQQPNMMGDSLLPPPPVDRGGFFGGDTMTGMTDWATSPEGMGAAAGSFLPMLLGGRGEGEEDPNAGYPDLSTMRPMDREVNTPPPSYKPGLHGEFDYGISDPYISGFTERYAPRRYFVGGLVGREDFVGGLVGREEEPTQGFQTHQERAMDIFQNEYGGDPNNLFALAREFRPWVDSRQAGDLALMGGGAPIGVSPIDRFSHFLTHKHQPEPEEKGEEDPNAGYPDLSTMRRMDREVNTPPPSYKPGLHGEFDYGISDPYIPEKMSNGGFIRTRFRDPFGAPVMMSMGGLAQFAEDPQADSMGQPNEREVISGAISAIKGAHPEPEMALAMFLQMYGEEALRDLVDRVQSGEFEDTQERFAEGENGEVVGPGDGSGVDDMVPALVEGEGDVLLSDGEFVLRKDATDALNRAFGPDFMDTLNNAGSAAPEVVMQMLGA